jgi:hypothetical protein
MRTPTVGAVKGESACLTSLPRLVRSQGIVYICILCRKVQVPFVADTFFPALYPATDPVARAAAGAGSGVSVTFLPAVADCVERLRGQRRFCTGRPGPDAENRHDRRRQKNRPLEKS